jgi:hypothetical protein
MPNILRRNGHSNGSRWDPLVRELAVIILIKVVAIMAIWFAFFSGPEKASGPGAVADKFLQSSSAPAPKTQNRS